MQIKIPALNRLARAANLQHVDSEVSDLSPRRFVRIDSMLCGILVLLCFAFVYSRSLTLVYVEGDDAAIVAYHALGRNFQLQPLYSPYQSMLDAVLALLPPKEYAVRQTAIILTAVSAPVFVYLILLLAFDWSGDIRRNSKWLVAVLMLLAVPEFFYLGMVLTPSILAMTVLLGAHLVIRRATATTATPGWGKIVISLVLFGIGAAFRWDTVIYGAVIVSDLFFRASDRLSQRRPAYERLRLCLIWGVLAGSSWLLVVTFNGWSLKAVLQTILSQGPVESLDWKFGVARAQTFFTPAIVCLTVLGLSVLVRKKHPLAPITVLAILPVSTLILYGVPKWFITAIPCLFGCAFVGLCLVLQRPYLRYGLLVLIVVPWLVGIQWSHANTAWGPSFELRPYNRILTSSSVPALAFGPGMAIPTPEGPRPLFGHGWVLFSAWRHFVVEYSSEQEAAVSSAITAQLPLLLDEQGQSWFINIFLAQGYSTDDPISRKISNDRILERRWVSREGSEIRMVQFTHAGDLFNRAAIDRLRATGGDVVVISAFSSNMLRLHRIAPDAVDPLGKRTALLDLGRLSAKLPHSSPSS